MDAKLAIILSADTKTHSDGFEKKKGHPAYPYFLGSRERNYLYITHHIRDMYPEYIKNS